MELTLSQGHNPYLREGRLPLTVDVRYRNMVYGTINGRVESAIREINLDKRLMELLSRGHYSICDLIVTHKRISKNIGKFIPSIYQTNSKLGGHNNYAHKNLLI